LRFSVQKLPDQLFIQTSDILERATIVGLFLKRMSDSNAEIVGLLFSGGLDSSILLGELLRQGNCVQPIYVQCGLFWEAEEFKATTEFLRAVACAKLRELVVLQLPTGDLYGQHWSITGRGVPDADSPDEAVYLPGRNPLLLLKARIWCQLNGIGTLAIGCLGNNPFADATEEFFAAFGTLLDNAIGGKVTLTRSLADLAKSEIMQRGRALPLEKTFSCIRPENGLHCGQCNKCAERRAAFRFFESGDPTQYATNEAATVSE